MPKLILFIIISLNAGFISNGLAQEHSSLKEKGDTEPEHHETHPKHLISASVNHTVIFSGSINGESKSTLFLPSFALNYTYSINQKWAVGLHNDMIIEEFVIEESGKSDAIPVESENEGFIERGTPIAVALVLMYKPLPVLGLMVGAGREFSKHEDFNLIRFGIEVPFHLPHHWELFGVATYDINIDAYDSLNYGIGIGKLF